MRKDVTMRKVLWAVVALLTLSLLAGVPSYAAAKKKPPVKPPLPRILDLGSDKCIPCKLMVPVLDSLAKEYKGKLVVQFVDTEKRPDVKQKYRVRMIPTQILFNAKGKEIARHMGFWPREEILKAFKQHGVKLVPNPPPPKAK
jgi:thioredoxin 1